MAIYFVRHGESEANLRNVFAGQREDSPLTQKGERQAEAAGKSLASTGITKIYASKLNRASQTAQIIAGVVGIMPDEIVYDDRLIEYDMGSITGSMLRPISSSELVSSVGAEDPVLCRERILSFLSDHKSDGDNILIVSHAGIARAVESARLNLDPYKFYDIQPYPNAEPVMLDLSWLD